MKFGIKTGLEEESFVTAFVFSTVVPIAILSRDSAPILTIQHFKIHSFPDML